MHTWQLNMGANYLQNGEIQFKVWAPKAENLALVFIKEDKEEIQYPMQLTADGIFQTTIANLISKDYVYRINEQKTYPDPFSRSQPFGVNGPSRVYNPNDFQWTDSHWKGLPLKDYIIYELHVGTFTPKGTFEALIDKIAYFKDLGVSAIELMPVAEFPGNRNWGYDGVYPFAPHHEYGGLTGLKKFINACHENDLAVIIDVVYNHLGPEGNYLSQFGHYFTEKYKTPWGLAINLDGAYSDPVRQYFIDNALYWLTEYHADALRLDAIHTIFDFSAKHFLEQLSRAFHGQANQLGRLAFIIAESDLNDVRVIKPIQIGGYAMDGQWSDDFHHSQHSYMTKNQWRYFADFGKLSHIAKAITDGFVYNGIPSKYRKKTFGSNSKDLPGEQFVICIQNHDQVGNACLGKRLGTLITIEEYKIVSLLLLCAPNIPLLFMGQEWNATTPFYFFTSYIDSKLGNLVREGYQKEFDLHDSEKFNPQSIQRFEDSKLLWSQLDQTVHKEMLNFYKKLIHIRKTVSCLSNCRKDLTDVSFSEEERWMTVKRDDPSGSKVILAINFNDKETLVPIEFSQGVWQIAVATNDSKQESSSFQMDNNQTNSVLMTSWTANLFYKTVSN